MKLVKKVAEGIGVFAPIIILVFACVSYLSYTQNENSYPEEVKKEMKNEVEKKATNNSLESFMQYRD